MKSQPPFYKYIIYNCGRVRKYIIYFRGQNIFLPAEATGRNGSPLSSEREIRLALDEFALEGAVLYQLPHEGRSLLIGSTIEGGYNRHKLGYCARCAVCESGEDFSLGILVSGLRSGGLAVCGVLLLDRSLERKQGYTGVLIQPIKGEGVGQRICVSEGVLCHKW